MNIRLSVLVLVCGAAGPAAIAAPPQVQALLIKEAPRIDGVVGEPLWQQAPRSTDFVQQDPNFGEASSERTEVRFLFDGRTLFVGIICFDSEPGQIIVSQSRRDGTLEDDDSIQIVLDTYKDNQNGYVFGTNPAGVQFDGQVTREGRSGGFTSPVSGTGFGPPPQGGAIGGFNLNWNGVWQVQSQITDRGWEAEMAIPFSTLRFGEGKAWGLNILRIIRRRNEFAFWAPIPRSLNLHKVSLAGDLTGIHAPQGSALDLTPYLLAGVRKDPGPEKGNRITELGLDAKYALTPSLSLDLTYNTDFAQVEVDDAQVNLTRFSLFFPEKRPFFLENAGFFQFGTPQDVELFFSRRIGLDESDEFGTQPIPILGGARLTGKLGRYSLGILDMQTEELEGVAPANNFFVARLNREFGTRSTVGTIFTNRQATSRGGGDDHNRTVGLDANLGFGRDLTLFSYIAKSATPGLHGDDLAGRVLLDYNTDLWVLQGGYTEVQENFNPETGFLRREAYRRTEFEVHFTPRPENSWIRNYDPHVSWNRFYGMDGTLETDFLHMDYVVRFQNGGRAGAALNHRVEFVRDPFDIAPGVFIPAGRYDWREVSLNIFSDPSSDLFGGIRYIRGGFYGGNRDEFRITGGMRSSEKFLLDVRYQLTDAETAGGDFQTHLAQLRLNYSFTPQRLIQALIQFNNNDKILSTNLRLSLLKQSSTGLFIVYNELRDTINAAFPVVDRALQLKYTHLFRF